MSNKICYRQGEVLLIKQADDTTLGDPASCVLAEGEITGHKHEIVDGEVYETRRWGEVDKLVVSNGKTTLKHPEHGEINIDKGIWGVRIQREYDELNNRLIAD